MAEILQRASPRQAANPHQHHTNPEEREREEEVEGRRGLSMSEMDPLRQDGDEQQGGEEDEQASSARRGEGGLDRSQEVHLWGVEEEEEEEASSALSGAGGLGLQQRAGAIESLNRLAEGYRHFEILTDLAEQKGDTRIQLALGKSTSGGGEGGGGRTRDELAKEEEERQREKERRAVCWSGG